jgi:class 3 adenylate cyclase
MIADGATTEWLEHRAGVHKLSQHPKLYSTRALELSDKGDAFANAFGNKEIRGFAGFVDLVGFSNRVSNSSPSQISDYLRPFLSGVIDEALGSGALIDKTIGDEVLFALPDMQDDGGVPAILFMGSLMGGLHDLQRRLGSEYPFRIGLAYGAQFIDRIEGKGYAEWTIVGESVILAKRLHTLPGAEPNDGIAGAFGALTKEVTEQKFETILGFIAGFASRMTHQIVDGPVTLKGVSAARCAILTPKVPANQWKPGMTLD